MFLNEYEVRIQCCACHCTVVLLIEKLAVTGRIVIDSRPTCAWSAFLILQWGNVWLFLLPLVSLLVSGSVFTVQWLFCYCCRVWLFFDSSGLLFILAVLCYKPFRVLMFFTVFDHFSLIRLFHLRPWNIWQGNVTTVAVSRMTGTAAHSFVCWTSSIARKYWTWRSSPFQRVAPTSALLWER